MPLDLNSHIKQTTSGRVSILDFLTKELHCTYLSDLSFLKDEKKQQVIEAVTNLPVDGYTLQDWNDALNYLVRLPAQNTAEEAKSLLLSALSDPCPDGACP